MAGLLHLRVPLLLRRVVALIPALIVLTIGFDPTSALVLSQVFLSIGVPFALIPLVAYAQNREIMGQFTNPRVITWLAWIVTALIVLLNVILIVLIDVGES